MIDENKTEFVAGQLRERIKANEFGSYGRLPPIAQLAKEYKIARQTMHAAITLLRGEGWLILKGRVFFAQQITRVSANVVPPFEQVLASQGAKGTFVKNLIEPEIIQMPADVAAMFGVEKGLHVVHRYRLQGKEELPYRLSEYWFPAQLVTPDMLQRLKADASFDIIEDIKIDLGIVRQSVHDDVFARFPSSAEAKLLRMQRTSPVQEVRRTNRTMGGQVIMHHRIVFVGSLSMLGYDYEISNADRKLAGF